MANNTRMNMSNKYWENETPIVTETAFGGISYFKEAGKIQLYSVYEKDGELLRGKGCTWDNNEMEVEDALRLVYAMMHGLIDVGVENDAFSDAYNLLKDAVDGIEDDDDEEDEAEEALDEEFEDETPDYSDLKVSELKEIAISRGLELPKRATKQSLVTLLEADDESSDKKDEDNLLTLTYVGKHIVYDGKKDDDPDYIGYHRVTKRTPKLYEECMDDCNEWVTYIIEKAEQLVGMPVKTQIQKKKQDEAYGVLKEEVADWVSSWEEIVDENELKTIMNVAKDLMYVQITEAEAMIVLAKIIDNI